MTTSAHTETALLDSTLSAVRAELPAGYEAVAMDSGIIVNNSAKSLGFCLTKEQITDGLAVACAKGMIPKLVELSGT